MVVQVSDLFNEFKKRINGNNHSKGGQPDGFNEVRRVDQQSKPKGKKKNSQPEEVQQEESNQPEEVR